jgi:filamentous hemagglutinin family protein
MRTLISLVAFGTGRTAFSAAIALLLASISIASGGNTGNILARANPVFTANQQANAISRLSQTAQSLQAMQNAANALRALNNQQASPIRGGGVIVNVTKSPNAVPSEVLASFHTNGKVYVINRNGVIFGASKQINTHELTGAAMGATSDWMAEVARKQRAQAAAQKEVPSRVSVEVLGYGSK